MASRYFNQFVLTPTKRQVLLSGKIVLNASAAVVSHDIPFVASVAKSDTGEYTITLQDQYVELRSCQLTMQTTEDLVARIKSHDVSSAKTVVVETATGATATDASAAAEIHVTLIFRDSSVGV
jgi:Asp-tRNA(Asn)/Glu-tRNA(Gln) amidotransferase B subunit